MKKYYYIFSFVIFCVWIQSSFAWEVAKHWYNYKGGYGLEAHNISIHKGYLYVFIGNSNSPGKVYRTQDLTNWEDYIDLHEYGYVRSTFWPSEEFQGKLVIGGQVDGKGAVIVIDDKKIVEIPNSDEIMGMAVKDNTLYLGSWDKKVYYTKDLSTFDVAFKLPNDSKGGAGTLAVYPSDNKLYVAENVPLPAEINTDSNWGRIYSWDGSKLAAVYSIPRGGAVQDCVAILKPYFSHSGMEPVYLYIGTSSGNVIRFDGKEWTKDITLDLPIVGLNSQEVGGIGMTGSATLVVTTGYFRHLEAEPYPIYQQSGSVWISDSVSWWKIIDNPAISFARSKSFGGNLLVSTLYLQELSYAAIYKIGPANFQELLAKSKPVRPQVYKTVITKNNITEIFSVPNGRQLLIYSMWLSTGSNNTGYIESFDGKQYFEMLTGKNNLSINPPIPIKIPAGWKIYIKSEHKDETVSGGILGELERY